jgi:hypothetical protein
MPNPATPDLAEQLLAMRPLLEAANRRLGSRFLRAMYTNWAPPIRDVASSLCRCREPEKHTM